MPAKTDPVPRYQIDELYNWLVKVTGTSLLRPHRQRHRPMGMEQRSRILGRVVLNGGDIERMSSRAFLFAADALRLEDGVGFHVETAAGGRFRRAVAADMKPERASDRGADGDDGGRKKR